MRYMDSRGTNPTRCGSASDNAFTDVFPTLHRFLGYRGSQTKYLISDVRYGLPDSMRSTQVKKHDVVAVFTLCFPSTIERKWRVASGASCNAVSTAPELNTTTHSYRQKKLSSCHQPQRHGKRHKRGAQTQINSTQTIRRNAIKQSKCRNTNLAAHLPKTSRTEQGRDDHVRLRRGPNKTSSSTVVAKNTDRNIPRNVSGQAFGAQSLVNSCFC